MTTGTLDNVNLAFQKPFFKELEKNWGWYLALGILMIVTGLVAIGTPFVAAVAVELFVGWALLFGGVFQIIHAIKCRGRQGFVASLLVGILTLLAAFVLLFYPMAGVITLTLILGMFFITEGIFRSIEAFQIRPQEGWGWLLFTGVVEGMFGILIFLRWPSSAVWLIGLLVGIDLLFNGWSMVALSLVSRKMKKAEALSQEKKAD